MTPEGEEEKAALVNRCLIFDDTDGNVGATEFGEQTEYLGKMRWRYARLLAKRRVCRIKSLTASESATELDSRSL